MCWVNLTNLLKHSTIDCFKILIGSDGFWMKNEMTEMGERKKRGILFLKD